MPNIYNNTRQKLFILFLFTSFFGLAQKSYELRVKSKVIQDSLLIDLEITNTGNSSFNFGVGQFVFGFVDTLGIQFSAGEVLKFGEFSPPISSCYSPSVFNKFKAGKFVNFQINKVFGAPSSCSSSTLISGGATKKLATLYFPISDCSQSIEFVTPSGSGDARVDLVGQDLEKDLGFSYNVVYMPSGLPLSTNNGYSFELENTSVCVKDTLKMWVANAKDTSSLTYRFYKQGAIGPKILLATQTGNDTLYKSFGEVLNTEQVFVEVDNGTTCLYTSPNQQITVSANIEASFTYSDTCLGEATNFVRTSTTSFTTTTEWFFGDGSLTSNAPNPSHSYAQKGIYDVKLKLVNGLCSDSITKSITIIGIDKPNLGNDTASCSGDPITISPENNSGYDFNWKEKNEAAFSNPGNSFSAINPGEYIVRADSSGSGCFAYDTIQVSHNTLGVINFPQDTSVCNGVELNYSISVPLTSSVEWQDTSGTALSNTSSFSYAGSAGDIAIKVKVIDGGCGDSTVFTITKVSGVSVTSTPSVGQLDPNTLEFKWDKVLGASDYKVTYTVNSTPVVTGVSIGSDTSYVINGLAIGGNVDTVNFFFEVTGADASCGSAMSMPISQVIGSCANMPPASNIDTAKVNGVSASTLSFIWNSVEGAVGYEVQYAINGATATSFQAIGSDTTYTVTGLMALDVVTFTYKAFTNCEDRLKSSIATSFDCNTNWTGANGSPYCTSSFNQVLKADIVTPFYRFEGVGVRNSGDTLFYFKPQEAGPGTHTISLIGCYNNDTTSKQVQVDPAPCISTSDTSTLKVPFEKPQAIFTDCNGQIYFSDNIENTVIKIDSFGLATTLLGVGSGTFGFKDGHIDSALFNQVTGLVVHPTSDVIYFVDGGNHAVRKFDPFTQMITTLAGGENLQNTGANGGAGDSDSPTDADGLLNKIFTTPFGIAFSAGYDSLFISDKVNNKIKVLRLSDNSVHYVAGSGGSGTTDGSFSTATFTELSQINFDHLTKKLYVGTSSLFGSPKIRFLNFNNGQVETMTSGPLGFVMQDGKSNVANHLTPIDVAPNGQGDLFIIDKGFCALRVYKSSSDSVISIIGTPGATDNCGGGNKLNEPSALSVFVKGFIDIVDTKNDRILRVSIEDFLNGPLSNVDSSYCQFSQADTLNDVSVPGTYTLFPANNNVLYQANGKWVFNPIDTGRYELCFNHKIGACTNNECMDIYVAPLPVVDLGYDTLMCPSQAGNYRIQTNGDTTFSFQWYEKTASQGIYFTRSNDTLYHTNITEYGNYVLESKTRYGCESSDTLTVRQSPDLKIEITSIPGQYSCIEDGARLLTAKISNSPGVRSYLWNTGDTTELISVDKAGTYLVSAQDSIGCVGDTSFVFNVHPTPFVQISTPNKISDAIINTLVKNNDTLISPYGMIEDNQGNFFITDNVTHVILKYEKANDILSVFAGERYQSGYRDGTNAWFNQPKGITIDSLNNLYVADEKNNVIRKITPSGVVSTHIGQFYTSGISHRDTVDTYARFNGPTDVTIDGTGGFIIADKGNNVVRTYNIATRRVKTIGEVSAVGTRLDGTYSSTKFNEPSSVFVHQTGGVIVGEKGATRFIEIVSSEVTTLDDGSVGDPESFTGNVLGVSSFGGRNIVSIVENNNKILFSTNVSIATGTLSNALTNLYAGKNSSGYVDSNALNAEFSGLQGIYDGEELYVSDANNHAIRTIKDSNYVVICPGDTIQLSANAGGDYNWIFNNNSIGTSQVIDISLVGLYTLEYTDQATGCLGYDSIYVNSVPTPIAVIDSSLTFTSTFDTLTYCFDDSIVVYAQTEPNTNYEWLLDGVQVGTDTVLTLTRQQGELILSAENTITGCLNYDTLFINSFEDTLSLGNDLTICVGDCEILDAGSGYASYLWSSGLRTQTFEVCRGGVFDVEVTTTEGCVIYDTISVTAMQSPQVDINGKRARVTTLAGDGSINSVNSTDPLTASFNSPHDIVVDSKGNTFVADEGNNQIRKITSSGVVTTFINVPKPTGITIDQFDTLYVALFDSSKVIKIDPLGNRQEYAGTNITGYNDGNGDTAMFFHPFCLRIDENRTIYVADAANHVVRQISAKNREVSTIGIQSNNFISYVDGDYNTARFNHPGAVSVDYNGDVYVSGNADNLGARVRKIDTKLKEVTTHNLTSNSLQYISIDGLAVDDQGRVYSSINFHQIGVQKGTGLPMESFTGSKMGTSGSTDGLDSLSSFHSPEGMYYDRTKNELLVADRLSHKVRKVTFENEKEICLGDSVLLEASSNSIGTFTWNTGENGTSIYGDTAGTYVVTFKDNVTGCISVDSVVVTLRDTPIFASVTTDTTICLGDSIDIFATTQIVTDSIFWYKNSVSSALLSSDENTDTIYNITHGLADTYYAVASNGVCTDTTEVVVTPSDLLLSVLALKDTLCYNDTTQLDVNVTSSFGIESYVWDVTNASGISLPNTLDADSLIVSPVDLGDNKYLVTVRDSNSCEVLDSINVFLLDSLDVTFSEDTLYQCTGGATQYVKTAVSGGKLGYSFNWSVPTITGLTISPIADSVGVTYSGDTSLVTYIVMEVTDANNCIKEDSVRIELTSFEIQAIAQFDTVCPNTNNLLDILVLEGGVGPYSYAWSPNVMLNDSTLKSPTSILALNQQYEVLVMDSTSGCSAKDSITITVLNLNALVGTKGIDTFYVCENDSYILDASNSNGGSKPYSFAWTQINGDDIGATSPTVDTDDSLSVSNGTVGTSSLYKIDVRDDVGCIDSDSIRLIWNNTVSFNLSVDSLLGCVNTSDSLVPSNVVGGILPYTYQWNVVGNATTNCVNCDTVIVTYQNRDTSTVTLTVTDGVGCIAMDSVSIRGYDLIIDATAQLGQVCTGITDTLGVVVTQDSVGKFDILWSPAAFLNDASALDPIVTITSAQKFVVEVIDSITGCVASDSIEITVQNINAVISNPSIVNDTLVVCFDSPNLELNATQTSGGSPEVNSPFYVYDWSSVSTVSFVDNTLDTVSLTNTLTDTTQIYLSVNDRVGCEAKDSIVVVWDDELITSITGPEYLCQGDTSKAIIMVSGGNQTVQSIDWTESNVSDNIVLVQTTRSDSVGVVSTGLTGKDTLLATVTNRVGCKVTDSLIVTLSQLQASVLIDDDTICSGFDITAKALVTTGVGPYGYNWESSTFANIDSLVKTISSSELIEVQIIDSATLCQITESVRVIVDDINVAINVDDNTVYHCFEDSTTTIVLAPISGGNKNYINSEWTNNATVVQTNTSNLSLTIDDNSLTDSNVIIFSIEDTKGCSGADTISVYRNNEINTIAGTASDVCLGDSVQLNATASNGGTGTTFIYAWSSIEGNFSNSSSLVTAYKSTIVGNKVLTLTATDNGYPETCTNSSSVSVEIKALPSVIIEDSTYCSNVSLVVDLSDNGNNYSGSETVVWKLDDNVIIPSNDRVTLTNQIGDLKVIVTDNGCTDSISVSIDTMSLPVANISIPNEVCDFSTISIVGSFVDPVSSFTWTENGNSSITKDSIITSYLPNLDAGYVIFTLEGTNVCGSNSYSDSTLVNVTPIAKINVSDTTVLKGSSVSFVSLTTGNNLEYNWEFTQSTGVRTESGAGTFTEQYSVGIRLPVLHTVTDTKTTCSSEVRVFVTIFDQVVYYIPNVFSPEAENVENKTFKIYGENIEKEGFGITIFNRWGQEVYSSSSLDEMKQIGWDGAEALQGTYTYTLKMKLSDGELVEKVGNVTLIK